MHLAARRKLRTRFRDGAAISAFASVALSGVVPIWALIAFAVTAALSFFDVRPLAGRRAWSVVALLLTGIALFGLVFVGALDLIIAAVSFAVLVAAHRLISEVTPATDRQVLLTSLLLMAGGAALSGEIWYALCLLAFGVMGCLQLGLQTIEGPVEREVSLPVAPVVRQLSVGVVVAIIGALAFFILFPRLSWRIAARGTSPGVLGGSTGMTDRVRLGGGGDIKTSTRVIARITMTPSPKAEQLEAYWVGRYFDLFDGKEWRGTGTPTPSAPMATVGKSFEKQVEQRIELTAAYGARTLIGLDSPVGFWSLRQSTVTDALTGMMVKVEGEEVRAETPATTYTYRARSSPNTTSNDDGTLPKYLELPTTLDPRVRELASQLKGTATEPAAIAERLERSLKGTYGYTLELPGDVDDPLADFLFRRREGHCEHFATALAVLLRVNGVPARVVGGFFGGEHVGEGYVLHAGDAHAWVQAFIPGSGWRTYDATPEAGRLARGQRILAVLTNWYEQLEELWRARVVDYSIQDQVAFVRSLVRPPQSEVRRGETAQTPVKNVAIAVGVAFVIFLLARAALRPRARKHPAAGFLDELEERLAKANVPRRDHEPVEELSRRLQAERHPMAGPVGHAVRRYLEARFSNKPVAAEERKTLLAALTIPAPPR